jgi:LmbE family N-acetylglucosaminyl deacetylase
MGKMNVLAIGAHPDDIEFGCGGTLSKFTRHGHNVYLMVMTKGDQGGEPEVRQKEQMDAAIVLGAKTVFWGDYPDTHLAVDKEFIGKIEATITLVKPDFIFCSYHQDSHQDHRHLAQATISATRSVRNVLFFEGPTTQDFNPQVYVDISTLLGQKIEALKAHRSQVDKTNIEGFSIAELASSTATFRGIQGRVKYAEAFHSLRLFINIPNF